MQQTTFTIKELARIQGSLNSFGPIDIKFEIRNPFGTTTRIIAGLRPSVTARGNFSTTEFLCKENGKETIYRGKVEVVLVATHLKGVRRLIGAAATAACGVEPSQRTSQ